MRNIRFFSDITFVHLRFMWWIINIFKYTLESGNFSKQTHLIYSMVNEILSTYLLIYLCRCWETFMVLLVAYSAWVYPFEFAFLHSSPDKKLYIADSIVDLFFAIDIFLTFFVAYIHRRSQLLVREPKKIALRLVLYIIIN